MIRLWFVLAQPRLSWIACSSGTSLTSVGLISYEEIT